MDPFLLCLKEKHKGYEILFIYTSYSSKNQQISIQDFYAEIISEYNIAAINQVLNNERAILFYLSFFSGIFSKMNFGPTYFWITAGGIQVWSLKQ